MLRPSASAASSVNAPPTLELIEQLYHLHGRRALGYAFALLKDRPLAEAAVEDALIHAWRAGLGAERNAVAAGLLLLSLVRRAAGATLERRGSAAVRPTGLGGGVGVPERLLQPLQDGAKQLV